MQNEECLLEKKLEADSSGSSVKVCCGEKSPPRESEAFKILENGHHSRWNQGDDSDNEDSVMSVEIPLLTQRPNDDTIQPVVTDKQESVASLSCESSETQLTNEMEESQAQVVQFSDDVHNDISCNFVEPDTNMELSHIDILSQLDSYLPSISLTDYQTQRKDDNNYPFITSNDKLPLEKDLKGRLGQRHSQVSEPSHPTRSCMSYDMRDWKKVNCGEHKQSQLKSCRY
jgi:hypothetical protein